MSTSSRESYVHRTGNTIPDPSSVEESGRTWHGYKDGKYYLPNDSLEQDRLDMQHALWQLMMKGALSWAPFEGDPIHVLDVGTGTGIWAIEFAKLHPKSRVIGTDLSIIQPQHAAPKNLTFVRDDVEDIWIWGHLFHYVHMRMMFTCFNDAKQVLRTVFEHLAPGGYVEYQDSCLNLGSRDGTFSGTHLQQWCQLMKSGAKALGRDLSVCAKYKDWMREIGFVDIEEKVIYCPGNPWPSDPEQKEMGRFLQADMMEGVEGISLRILQKGLGMSLEEINELVSKVKLNVRDGSIHFHWPWYVVYGRKPFDG